MELEAAMPEELPCSSYVSNLWNAKITIEVGLGQHCALKELFAKITRRQLL